jgi:hypothetical protein
MPKPDTFCTVYDRTAKISIRYLKEQGYLDGYKAGTISWYVGNTHTGTISISVDVRANQPQIMLSYSISGEPIEYCVLLEQVPSNLGKGYMWLFLCPFTQKRCRILYQSGRYFMHRDAGKGMYSYQTMSKTWRDHRRIYKLSNGEQSPKAVLGKKYFKGWYKGRPTRRLLRAIRKVNRISQINEALQGHFITDSLGSSL